MARVLAEGSEAFDPAGHPVVETATWHSPGTVSQTPGGSGRPLWTEAGCGRMSWGPSPAGCHPPKERRRQGLFQYCCCVCVCVKKFIFFLI